MTAVRGSPQVDVHVVDTERDLAALAPAWILLGERASATPFQTYAWNAAWWSLVGARRSTLALHVVVFAIDGIIRAIAPFATDSSGQAPILRFLTAPYADFHDVLVDPSIDDPTSIYERLLLHLRAGPFGQVELLEMPATNSLTRFLASCCGRVPGLRPVEGESCVRLDLLDAEAFVRATTKHETMMKIRRLRRNGTLTCCHYAEPDAIAERMPDYMTMHLRQWQLRPDRGITFDSPDIVRFYQGAVRRLASAGLLLLTELSLDGYPIAYYYGFGYRRSYWAYRTTFETKLAKHSPGQAILFFMFTSLRRMGFESFEFMRSPDSYKLRYANCARPTRGFALERVHS